MHPELIEEKLKDLLDGKVAVHGKSHVGEHMVTKVQSAEEYVQTTSTKVEINPYEEQKTQIDNEWEKIKKERDTIAKIRDQLEQERLDFERQKGEDRKGLQSERGTRSPARSDKLEEHHSPKNKGVMTARGPRRQLDAVRES